MRKLYKREDLGKGMRGKHLAAYSKGTNLVLISPDVAAVFPTTEAVNEALRGLVQVAERVARPTLMRPGRVKGQRKFVRKTKSSAD
jgi:hypothetical protein